MTMVAHVNPRSVQLAIVAALSLCVTHVEAALQAKGQYKMDKQSDCQAAGILDLPRGQTTFVGGKSYDLSTSTTTLGCRLQFAPEKKGDDLYVALEPGAYINDCGVSLEIQMTNAQPTGYPLINGPDGKPIRDGKYILGCRSDLKSVPQMEARDGQVSLWLSRKSYDDRDFGFQISVRAERPVEKGGVGGSSSSDDTGMIVGIVAGVIILLIILIILCVCCYRKRQRSNREKPVEDPFKKDMSKDTLTSVVGYDEKHVKNGTAQPQESPGSDRRLLNRDYDDSGKPRSALERFGPTPSQRGQSRERSLGRRQDDYQDTDTRRRGDYEDREIGRPRGENVERQSPPKSPLLTDLQNNAKFRRSFHESEAEPQRQSPPKSPILAALHNNPKFRKSFHENEADADERVRRVSDYSSGSVDSAGKPKPKLPPVPKSPPRSPSPQRRGEKIAGIFRARPSSSSSELTKFDDESEDDRPRNSEKKRDTRHTLRPDKDGKKASERKPRESRRRDHRSEDSDDERRERDRKDEEKRQRRRQREEEEERERKEEERRQRRKEEDKRRREEEEEERQKEREHEGRFKKSTSGRRSKGKGPTKMGRSRSTGNALDEMEASHQRSRSKSPSSVRSLSVMDDDDDDDLDSNYMPFKRSGSRTSLYASRSSLYGRRRKNSQGETMSMSSYALDDVDSRMGDFEKLSHRDKERVFRSTGELEMRPASALVVRDIATWTGNDKGVYVYGRKSLAKSRHGKRYSRGTQTISGRERRDSASSARSGRSARSNQRLKSKSKSQESLRKEKRSRSRDFSEDSDDSERARRRGRSKSRDTDYSEDESRRGRHRSKSRDLDDESDLYSSRGRLKPKPRSRKSAGGASVDYSGSEDESGDERSIAASSVAPSSIYPPSQQMPYATQFVPAGYPMVYQQPGVPYVPSGAPGGPPMMVPVAAAQVKPPLAPKPATAPKPTTAPQSGASKWDQLVNLTEGMKKRRHQMGESVTTAAETESVLSSMWSQPAAYHQPQVYYAPPSYNTAQKIQNPGSAYNSSNLDSAYALRAHQRDNGIEYGSTYAASESNV